MKMLRKCLSIALCLSVSVYTVPGFAVSAPVGSDAYKVELSDVEMSAAIGAGNVDATLADYRGGGSAAQAVFVNRATVPTSYQLNVVDVNGGVLETLASGSLDSSSAIIVSGTPTVANGTRIQARIWNTGVPGLEARDSSWAQ